jgi:hypothetical protein
MTIPCNKLKIEHHCCSITQQIVVCWLQQMHNKKLKKDEAHVYMPARVVTAFMTTELQPVICMQECQASRSDKIPLE